MGVYQRVVITGGISLFNAANLYRAWTDQTNLFRFERTNPLPANGRDETEALAAWKRECTKLATAPAPADPNRVSAEFSLLHALRVQGRLAEHPRVTLLHTGTLGGRAAAEALWHLLTACFGAVIRLREAAELDANNRSALRRSLGDFMEKVAAELGEGEPGSTCFAPVGGYKVMSSLGYLAGAYLGFPTAYLHEDNQVLHEIPAIPIEIPHEILQEGAALIRHLLVSGEATELLALSEADQEFARTHPYLFEVDDTLLDINTFARFIARRPENQVLFGDLVLLSPEAWQSIADANLRHYALGQLRELRKRLDRPHAFKNELHHEARFANLKNADFSLYKGAVKGTWVFYAAYRWDRQVHELKVNRLWFNHPVYTREAEAGTGFFGEPQAWRPWPEAALGG